MARAIGVDEVSRQIDEDEPDIALVKLHDDDEHALDLIDEIAEEAKCPVIALMEVPEPEFIARAAKRGIFAYVQPVTVRPCRARSRWRCAGARGGGELSGEVDQLEGAIRPARGDRACQGDPHGAPRARRTRRVRAASLHTRARTTASSWRWPGL